MRNWKESWGYPLTDTSIQTALRESVIEVLEKMFFIEASAGIPSEASLDAPVVVELCFEGDPPGVFRMSLARAAAALIAADFLGEEAESLNPHQVDEVAKELANMICGAVLSRIESSATFRLAPPGLISSSVQGVPGTVCAVETGSGVLIAGIVMETRVCSPFAKSAC